MLAMNESAENRGSIRTCVGCQKEAAPGELVRFVLGPDGAVLPVLTGAAVGRGAWVHPTAACLAPAAERGFSKSFRTAIRTSGAELAELIRAAASRRVVGLLAAAAGSKRLVIGGAEVDEALRTGKARLVVVATDARAAAGTREVEQAISSGRARAWGTKTELGRATHRTETAIVAVLDSGLGRALSTAIDWAHTPEPGPRRPVVEHLPTEE
jgi:predicted RNA-binding protein YlxR (DUF448 family)/ribosomal protein L30E